MGLIRFVLSWFVWMPFVFVYPRFPWWMLTPDDTVSPFGQYEATVRAVYEKRGKWVGDFYWLCIRNRLCGLAYARKPDKYKQTTDYSQFARSRARTWYGERFMVDGLLLRVMQLGRFEILSGWKVRGVVLDPLTVRQPVNMEFTPVFSVRLADH